jgi:hypothetical protein
MNLPPQAVRRLANHSSSSLPLSLSPLYFFPTLVFPVSLLPFHDLIRESQSREEEKKTRKKKEKKERERQEIERKKRKMIEMPQSHPQQILRWSKNQPQTHICNPNHMPIEP